MLESNISRLIIFITLIAILITVILLVKTQLKDLTDLYNSFHQRRMIMM